MTEKKRREKAVEIARDVLKWLRAKRMKVTTGTYCSFYGDTNALKGSLQKALPKLVTKSYPCRVCAKGALFIAAVDLFNKCSIGNKNDEEVVVAPLLKYFSHKTLDRIEAAFEGWEERDYVDFTKEAAFGYIYPNPKERLRAIVKNIIKHNGDFVVEPQ